MIFSSQNLLYFSFKQYLQRFRFVSYVSIMQTKGRKVTILKLKYWLISGMIQLKLNERRLQRLAKATTIVEIKRVGIGYNDSIKDKNAIPQNPIDPIPMKTIKIAYYISVIFTRQKDCHQTVTKMPITRYPISPKMRIALPTRSQNIKFPVSFNFFCMKKDIKIPKPTPEVIQIMIKNAISSVDINFSRVQTEQLCSIHVAKNAQDTPKKTERVIELQARYFFFQRTFEFSHFTLIITSLETLGLFLTKLIVPINASQFIIVMIIIYSRTFYSLVTSREVMIAPTPYPNKFEQNPIPIAKDLSQRGNQSSATQKHVGRMNSWAIELMMREAYTIMKRQIPMMRLPYENEHRREEQAVRYPDAIIEQSRRHQMSLIAGKQKNISIKRPTQKRFSMLDLEVLQKVANDEILSEQSPKISAFEKLDRQQPIKVSHFFIIILILSYYLKL